MEKVFIVWLLRRRCGFLTPVGCAQTSKLSPSRLISGKMSISRLSAVCWRAAARREKLSPIFTTVCRNRKTCDSGHRWHRLSFCGTEERDALEMRCVLQTALLESKFTSLQPLRAVQLPCRHCAAQRMVVERVPGKATAERHNPHRWQNLRA